MVESTLSGQGRTIKEEKPSFPRLFICYLRDLDSQDHKIGVVRLPKGAEAAAAIETAMKAYAMGPVSPDRELFTFIVRDGNNLGEVLKGDAESLNQCQDTLITVEELEFIAYEVKRLLKLKDQGSTAEKSRS